MKDLKQYFSKHYLPRWLVFTFDMLVPVFSWFVAFLLRFNFDLSYVDDSIETAHLVSIIPVFIISYLIARPYAGILRHSTAEDILRIIYATTGAGAALMLISFLVRQLGVASLSFLVLPYSVVIIFTFVVTSILVFTRLFTRIVYQRWLNSKKDIQKIMIFGAGRLGQTTLNALLMDTSLNIKVAGFIDDNTTLHNKSVSGIPIYSTEKAFDRVIPEHDVSEIIFAVDNSKISHSRKREITDKCLDRRIVVKEVPPVENWIKGELRARAIRPINIEDLLGRNSISLDRKKIERGLKESVVLVTGAAGSIGSEIVRQLIEFNVKKVIMLDKAESDIFNLQNEILGKTEETELTAIIGDVTNHSKLRRIFTEYKPTIVFNAAAYKHVPLMEEFPDEAFRVNVGGTKILADLSIEFGVEKFVFISTDKAVNPTNVMGATKRTSEMYIQSLAHSQKISTQFIITRFGNVLGSNGSVVPLFRKQIEKGGPVTITHKDITRYFMTIPEACQLVLEAGFIGKGGEIFVFDMGEPVKIYDLAKKMISLSGFVPHKEIEIKEVGLRPGEKLYEELLSAKEELQPTHNDKVMIAKDRKHDLHIVNEITDLLLNLDEYDRVELVEQMMRLVPEYISMNSYYTKKDGVKEEEILNVSETLRKKHRSLNKKRKAINKKTY